MLTTVAASPSVQPAAFVAMPIIVLITFSVYASGILGSKYIYLAIGAICTFAIGGGIFAIMASMVTPGNMMAMVIGLALLFAAPQIRKEI